MLVDVIDQRQAITANRRKVRAARDQRDFMASGGELRTEHGADRSGADDRNPHQAATRRGALTPPLAFPLCPLVEPRARRFAFFLHLHFRSELRSQLETNTVRVEEIDRLENMVVGDAKHFNAVRFQPRLQSRQLFDGINAQRDVVDPLGGVRRFFGGDVVAQIEESDARAVSHAKEDVRVRAVLAGRRHDVTLNDVIQRQPEDVLVKMPCFFRVLAAVRKVVQPVDRRGWGND